MDRGLAFLACDIASISVTDPLLTTDLPGGFSDLCTPVAPPGDPTTGNPSIWPEPITSVDPVDAARHLEWDLGTVSNTSGATQTLAFEYEVIVLDNAGNIRDIPTVDLNNYVYWDPGISPSSAPEVTVVEPTLRIIKTVDSSVVNPGDTVTYTITIYHAPGSNEDAFDVILTDTVPAELIYVPGSLAYFSGQVPSALSDAAAPDLTARWDTLLDNNTSAVIQFQAIVGVVPPNTSITNTAYAEWSSMPGDLSSPRSNFNTYSTERYYDPGDPINVYGNIFDSAVITTTGDGDLVLPFTGFAPYVETLLPIQSAKDQYMNFNGLWLEIPALNQYIPIVGVPITEDGWEVDWLGNSAGYLQGTAFPTWTGNTALTAHRFNASGLPGPFYYLQNLRYGDQVIIHAWGYRYIYAVRESAWVTPNDLSILDHEEYDWVTLITCQSYDESTGTYSWRSYVKAVLIKIESSYYE